MRPHWKRGELDQLAKFYSLNADRTAALLDAAAARPSRDEGLAFLGTLLRIGGLISLAAALVFFVAAHWSKIPVFGRFALVEVLLLGCAALALLKPPPSAAGRGALFLAFVATGVLLALFGQTYQTGADVYELFLGWALLGLPWVLAARWSVVTATWVLVLNLALVLFCGWKPEGGLLWVAFRASHVQVAELLLAAATLDLLLWFAADHWRPVAMPAWVRRLVLSCGFGFASWAGILAAFDEGRWDARWEADPVTLMGVIVLLAAVALYSLRRRDDVYPLAVVTGTFILVGMAWISRLFSLSDEAGLFVLALWLIVTSTIGSRILLSLTRQWRAAEQA